MEEIKWSKHCCNPFQKKGHWVSKELRKVNEWMISLNPEIKPNMKICTSCRLQLGKARACQMEDKVLESLAEDEVPGPSLIESDSDYVDSDAALSHLNASLISLGDSPVCKQKVGLHSSRKYQKEKLKRIKKTYKEAFFTDADNEEEVTDSGLSEMLQQLKEKFQISNKSEKLMILTLMPKSWSCKKIQDEFHVSNYIARKAKQLVQEKGILSSPDPKPGKVLPDDVVNLVLEFYCSDEVSRQMPGKKDYISMKGKDGQRTHVQKRLILGNLREIYQFFKSKHPSGKIGFSKFAELRPRNCVIAGSSGTHSVCVCTTHQNIKLMIVGAQLKKVTLKGSDTPLTTYQHCLSSIMCNPPSLRCMLHYECDVCPSIDDFKEALLTSLEDEMIDNITYKQWVSVDRCSFETLCKTTQEFVDDFSGKLTTLKVHDFIAKQQSAFFAHKKSTLCHNEAVVVCDFAENYSFVVQDEAQSFHWNNSMATVHPFVVYYKENGELQHNSFVFISEILKHDTTLFHAFQRKLVIFLKTELLKNLKKIFYFSDGSAAQYKNRKNFANLCHHYNDFQGIEAEWHFYATAHGKGACDGVGGTVKRLAAKASLQNPFSNQIMTPQQLFQWGKANIPAIGFFYLTKEEYLEEEKLLQTRFDEAVAVPGTQKFHAYLPISTEKLATKLFSFSEKTSFHRINIISKAGDIHFDQIGGFVACAYDNSWWMACILSTDAVEREVSLSFLHPAGPATSFIFPTKPDVLIMPANYILCKLDPVTATGRTYQLTTQEMAMASSALAKKRDILYN